MHFIQDTVLLLILADERQVYGFSLGFYPIRASIREFFHWLNISVLIMHSETIKYHGTSPQAFWTNCKLNLGQGSAYLELFLLTLKGSMCLCLGFLIHQPFDFSFFLHCHPPYVTSCFIQQDINSSHSLFWFIVFNKHLLYTPCQGLGKSFKWTRNTNINWT